jgi:hypothetical protein
VHLEGKSRHILFLNLYQMHKKLVPSNLNFKSFPKCC